MPPKQKAAKPSRAKRRAARRERWSQMGQAWRMTRENDPQVVLWVIGAVLLPIVVLLVVGLFLGHPVYFGILGLMVGLVAGMAIFTRRAQSSALRQVEGQPGASLGVVKMIRGGYWRADERPAQLTRQQDVVWRVLGRPGVVLLAEGAKSRTAGLVAQEKKKVARVAPDTPIYDVFVGNGEGEVPLRKLQSHLTKLPRNLKPSDVREIEGRLRALAATTQQPPLPKGPMPRSMRAARGKMR